MVVCAEGGGFAIVDICLRMVRLDMKVHDEMEVYRETKALIIFVRISQTPCQRRHCCCWKIVAVALTLISL